MNWAHPRSFRRDRSPPNIYSVVPRPRSRSTSRWLLRRSSISRPQVSGVSFTIRGDHATDIKVAVACWNRSEYRVATIDFLISGGDGYTIFAKAGEPERTGVMLRDAAVDFLQRNPGYAFRKDGRIHWEGSMRGLGGMRMR